MSFLLFKGDSGAGKTVGALSFPKPVILDFDRKMPAIANKHFPGKEIQVLQFKDALDAGDTIEMWRKIGSCPFETIIIDSVTSLSYAILKTIDDLKGQSILTQLRNIKSSGKGYKSVELRGYDSYNGEDSFLKFVTDGLKDLHYGTGNPKHVILIAHVMTSESTDIKTKEVTKTRRIVTAGSKIAAYIPAQFDDVWHFGIEHGDTIFNDKAARVKHFCVSEAIGDDYAKTAYNLPYKIDFTGGSLYDLVKDELTNNTQAQSQTQILEQPKNTLNF